MGVDDIERTGSHVRLAAKGLSAIFNPLSCAGGLLVGAAADLPAGGRAWSAGMALLFVVVAPAVHVMVLQRKGRLNRIFTQDPGARIHPLRVMSVSCFAGWALLAASDGPAILRSLVLCFGLQASMAAVYSARWRVSLHSVAAWGAQVATMILWGGNAIALVPLTVALSISRWVLGAHTAGQVLAGALVGGSATGAVLLLYRTVL